MTSHELQKKVLQGEGLQLEFKRKAAHPEKIAREMVAFANTKGGLLLVGVEDDKTIYGCKYPEEEIFAITEHLKKYCPFLTYHIERVAITPKREVIVFQVEEAKRKPIFLKDHQAPFHLHAFVRVADKSLHASTEMVFVLKYATKNQDFRFEYGAKEDKIMKYLADNEVITLQEAETLLKLPQKTTSITLVTLVRAGVLQIFPAEHGDYFTLSEKAFD